MQSGAPTGPSDRPQRPNVAAEVKNTMSSVAVALGWVLLALASLTTGLVALLTTLGLTKQANEAGSPVWMWTIAIFLTFGVPFALAAWRHHAHPKRIRATMAWLPLVWNATGLLLATQLIPDVTATALRNVEWVVQGRLGDSDPRTRFLSAVGQETADWVAPAPAVPMARVPTPAGVALDRAIAIPFDDHGTAIMLDIHLTGPSGEVTADYLFDTGASYTTITSDMAKQLGIDVPDDAPILKFNTASGPRESRMVYLPRVRLGDVEINGLLVSVCDPCANDRARGLLGLNVMREFFVQMDYQARQMQLLPRVREPNPNRSYDIEPVVSLNIEGRPEIWLGRVRWVVLVENRSTQAISDLVPRVKFNDGPTLLGAPTGNIEPGQTGRSLVTGKVTERDDPDAGALEFTLTVAEAHW